MFCIKFGIKELVQCEAWIVNDGEDYIWFLGGLFLELGNFLSKM